MLKNFFFYFRRENWRKRGKTSPILEAEPKNLTVISRATVMEQNAETNGCSDGPISLTITNHNDVSQVSKYYFIFFNLRRFY